MKLFAHELLIGIQHSFQLLRKCHLTVCSSQYHVVFFHLFTLFKGKDIGIGIFKRYMLSHFYCMIL